MSVILDITNYLKRRKTRLDERGAEGIDDKRILADILKPWYDEDAKGIAKSIRKWEPQKHPRDENGQFAETGSSGEKKEEEPAEKVEEKKEEPKKEAENPPKEKEEKKEAEKKAEQAPEKTSFKRSGSEIEVTKETPIVDYLTKQIVQMQPGKLERVSDFAGGTSKTPVKSEERLLRQYGGKPGDWAHSAGDGFVKYQNGRLRKVEIHWFENRDGEQFEWKVKYRNVRDRRK